MKESLKKQIVCYILIAVGSVLYAIGTVGFIFPNGLLLGGTSGISVILNAFLPFSPGTILVVINILLIVIAFFVLGKDMAIKTFVGSILTTAFIGLAEKIFALQAPIIENNYLSSMVGASIIAVASGVMFYVKSSSGGTDIVALIVKKYSKLEIGKALLVTDILIVVIGGILSGLNIAISSFLGLLIKTLGIDLVIFLIVKFIKKDKKNKKMIANFHTHTTFSDGKNTPEEVVLFAIEQGFCSIGFSDHAFTSHDQRYCMKDLQGYITEINRLKKKYQGKIQIYLGVEEDGSEQLDRAPFDYLIGSLHYLAWDGKDYIMDSNYDYYTVCAEHFVEDLALAKAYYNRFLAYLKERKPDIIGHFDLVTKFDEQKRERFLSNEEYWEIAENAVKQALEIGAIFELNTGLITRGFRTTPCPHERLLKVIAQNGGKVTLSSDAHRAQDLSAHFETAKALLKKVGFDGVYILYDNKWQKVKI